MTAIILLWFCVALILCFIWFDSRSHWYWKLPLFPLLIFSTLWVSNGYKDFMGWPHYEPKIINEDFELQWAVVNEQSKEILLWVNYNHVNHWWNFYKANDNTPRAIQIDYTRKMHEKVQEGLKMKAKGQRVGGQKMKGKLNEGKDGNDGQEGKNDVRYSEDEFIFYVLPSRQPIIK